MTQTEIHLEIYKTFYHSIEVLELRRTRVNRWNIAFLAAGFTVTYFINIPWSLLHITLFALLLCGICSILTGHIRYFATIARAKYDTLKSMEQALTSDTTFHPTINEWQKLPNDKIKQQGYSFVERIIPLGLGMIIFLAWLVIAINHFR